MNKNIYFLVLFILLIISCKKETNDIKCIRLSQNSKWATLDFKNNYTIQFPDDYFGEGKIGFEGNIFRKEKKDSSVTMSYSYCSPLFCQDFGDTLLKPFSNSIDIRVNNSLITLNQAITFCDSNSLQSAILYYNDKDNSYARLYLNDNEIYQQALEVAFNHLRLQEVLDVLKTIKKK